MLVESVVDCLCYLFLLGLRDLVFLVFRPRSYPVRNFLVVNIVPSLERGYVCRETLGGEQVECAPHCPSLDEGPVFPESILNVFDSDVFDPRPQGESGPREYLGLEPTSIRNHQGHVTLWCPL